MTRDVLAPCSDRRRPRGFTIHELMIAVAVFSVFAAAAGSLASHAYREHTLITDYQRDLAGWRQVLARCGEDLRAASAVADDARGVAFSGPRGVVRYALDGDVLRRDGAVIAARVEALTATTDADTGLVRLTLVGAPRSASGRDVCLSIAVLPRGGGGVH